MVFWQFHHGVDIRAPNFVIYKRKFDSSHDLPKGKKSSLVAGFIVDLAALAGGILLLIIGHKIIFGIALTIAASFLLAGLFYWFKKVFSASKQLQLVRDYSAATPNETAFSNDVKRGYTLQIANENVQVTPENYEAAITQLKTALRQHYSPQTCDQVWDWLTINGCQNNDTSGMIPKLTLALSRHSLSIGGENSSEIANYTIGVDQKGVFFTVQLKSLMCFTTELPQFYKCEINMVCRPGWDETNITKTIETLDIQKLPECITKETLTTSLQQILQDATTKNSCCSLR